MMQMAGQTDAQQANSRLACRGFFAWRDIFGRSCYCAVRIPETITAPARDFSVEMVEHADAPTHLTRTRR